MTYFCLFSYKTLLIDILNILSLSVFFILAMQSLLRFVSSV